MIWPRCGASGQRWSCATRTSSARWSSCGAPRCRRTAPAPARCARAGDKGASLAAVHVRRGWHCLCPARVLPHNPPPPTWTPPPLDAAAGGGRAACAGPPVPLPAPLVLLRRPGGEVGGGGAGRGGAGRSGDRHLRRLRRRPRWPPLLRAPPSPPPAWPSLPSAAWAPWTAPRRCTRAFWTCASPRRRLCSTTAR